jgi:hypothetical protein
MLASTLRSSEHQRAHYVKQARFCLTEAAPAQVIAKTVMQENTLRMQVLIAVKAASPASILKRQAATQKRTVFPAKQARFRSFLRPHLQLNALRVPEEPTRKTWLRIACPRASRARRARILQRLVPPPTTPVRLAPTVSCLSEVV